MLPAPPGRLPVPCKEGCLVGHSDLFLKGERPADVRAVSETILVVLAYHEMAAIYLKDPLLGMKVGPSRTHPSLYD